MKALGTIFATPKQLDAADRRAEITLGQALLAAEKELAGMSRRIVGGEVRYYKTDALYTPAPIRSGGVRRWFEVRADGDYPIKGEAK